MTAPWENPQGAVLPPPATTNLFWGPSPGLSRRPSLSPARPEAMVAGCLSDSEPEAESAPTHSEAGSGSAPGTEGHAASPGASFTIAFLQFVLESLVEDTGPRCEFS